MIKVYLCDNYPNCYMALSSRNSNVYWFYNDSGEVEMEGNWYFLNTRRNKLL